MNSLVSAALIFVLATMASAGFLGGYGGYGLGHGGYGHGGYGLGHGFSSGVSYYFDNQKAAPYFGGHYGGYGGYGGHGGYGLGHGLLIGHGGYGGHGYGGLGYGHGYGFKG
ncbi:uncharacterized protein LOC144141534 [Haemaphysalis longicornis]